MALKKKLGGLGSLAGLGGGLFKEEETEPPPPEQTAEAAGETIMSEALREFKDASKRENDRFATATSSAYWFGVYFETQEQRDEFLAKLKALDLLEVQWVNGRKLAARMGHELKSPRLPRRSFKLDPKLVDLSL